MPDLFQLPQVIPLKQGAIMPGAKLYFYRTNTSTPQAVYEDADLTTAFTQPVEADSDGIFPPIFKDPNLPDYRVTLTDSNDVVQPGYPIDDIPALSTAGSNVLQLRYAQDTGTINALTVTLADPPITSYSPGFMISILKNPIGGDNTGSATLNINGIGSRNIRHPTTGTQLIAGELQANFLYVFVYNGSADVFEIVSSSFAPGLAYNGAVTLTTSDTSALLNGVVFGETGNFVATLTGLTTSPTTTLKYKLNNGIATIYATTATTVGGTSNSTSFGLTGVLSWLAPATAIRVYCGLAVDNGNPCQCVASINTDGSISFEVLKVSGAYVVQDAWTNSGSKSLYTYFSLTYPVA